VRYPPLSDLSGEHRAKPVPPRPNRPAGVYGRLDDMLLIRGANVYPSQVQRSLLEVPGTGVEFKIVLEKKGALDQATVLVERDAAATPPDIDHFVADLTERVRYKLKNDTAVNFEASRGRLRASRSIWRPTTPTISPGKASSSTAGSN